MRTMTIAVCLLVDCECGDGGGTGEKAPPGSAAAAKAPLLEKLTCRTGPNDEQARLIVEAVKGRVMEFAFYSRLGTRVCSIHARRGDSFTQWQDEEANAGNAVVKLLSGSAHVEYQPGRMLLKFADVDRMKYLRHVRRAQRHASKC